ncbi:hypothetical protein WA158_006279 [Blastocystis sp. Blastoise]
MDPYIYIIIVALLFLILLVYYLNIINYCKSAIRRRKTIQRLVLKKHRLLNKKENYVSLIAQAKQAGEFQQALTLQRGLNELEQDLRNCEDLLEMNINDYNYEAEGKNIL